MNKKNKARQRPTQRQMKRWMDDLDAIRDEMRAADLAHLAEHVDSIAADIEADLSFQTESGPVVEFKGGRHV